MKGRENFPIFGARKLNRESSKQTFSWIYWTVLLRMLKGETTTAEEFTEYCMGMLVGCANTMSLQPYSEIIRFEFGSLLQGFTETAHGSPLMKSKNPWNHGSKKKVSKIEVEAVFLWKLAQAYFDSSVTFGNKISGYGLQTSGSWLILESIRISGTISRLQEFVSEMLRSNHNNPSNVRTKTKFVELVWILKFLWI